MATKLWYIKDEEGPVAVFEDKRSARDELENYLIEDEDIPYKIYSIAFEDLEDFHEELSLAEREGLV